MGVTLEAKILTLFLIPFFLIPMPLFFTPFGSSKTEPQTPRPTPIASQIPSSTLPQTDQGGDKFNVSEISSLDSVIEFSQPLVPPLDSKDSSTTKRGSDESNSSSNRRSRSKYGGSGFKQESLPAWKPVHSSKTVFPAFLILGIIFLLTGVGLWFLINSVKEVTIPYTRCKSLENSSLTCDKILKKNNLGNCKCYKNFKLQSAFDPPVHMYYELTKYSQNNRGYLTSRDDEQLRGNLKSELKECKPSRGPDKRKFFPCGAAANSMFNDEIILWHHPKGSDEKNISIKLTRIGILHEANKRLKFTNPPNFGPNSTMWMNFVKPKRWRKELWNLDTEHPENNGVKNEDFVIWMQPAALHDFKKLYRIINRKLLSGNYSLEIEYSYEVSSFNGTKSIVLTTTSLFGGRNEFLPIAFITVGVICICLGILLLLNHIFYGKRKL